MDITRKIEIDRDHVLDLILEKLGSFIKIEGHVVDKFLLSSKGVKLYLREKED